MRIGRRIIVPVILALSTAGSIAAVSAVPAVAAQTPAAASPAYGNNGTHFYA